MCCLALTAGFIGPRVALFIWWLFGDKVDAVMQLNPADEEGKAAALERIDAVLAELNAVRYAWPGYFDEMGKALLEAYGFPFKRGDDASAITPIKGRRARTVRGGKGAPEGWVCVVRPGRILFEMEGVDVKTAQEAMRLAAQKLAVSTKFVQREMV